MSHTDWRDVWSLFEQAAAQPPDEREAFLLEQCETDGATRRAIESMLEVKQQTFLTDNISSDALEVESVQRRSVPPRGDDGARVPHARRHAVEAPTENRIGPYRLLRSIGRGGMGSVYLAHRDDDTFARQVAIKLVRPDMQIAPVLRRMRTERQILATFEHPNIARLYDGGATDAGLPYFVLEYIDGTPIDAYVDEHRLSLDQRLHLFDRVCHAVHYAHQRLVVHRDIKPSNILVTKEGEPKLLDFGIAKLLDPTHAASGHEATAAWHRLMTPSYASPEQIEGGPITTASDVYSLGVLLYQVLTGRLPYDFEGLSITEIGRRLRLGEPPPPSQAAAPDSEGSVDCRRQLRGDLDAIVQKALRPTPDERYESVDALIADLRRFRDGRPVKARHGTWRYRVRKLLARHRVAAIVTAGIAALTIGFGITLAQQAVRLAQERDATRIERDRKDEVLALILEMFDSANPYVNLGEALTAR